MVDNKMSTCTLISNCKSNRALIQIHFVELVHALHANPNMVGDMVFLNDVIQPLEEYLKMGVIFEDAWRIYAYVDGRYAAVLALVLGNVKFIDIIRRLHTATPIEETSRKICKFLRYSASQKKLAFEYAPFELSYCAAYMRLGASIGMKFTPEDFFHDITLYKANVRINDEIALRIIDYDHAEHYSWHVEQNTWPLSQESTIRAAVTSNAVNCLRLQVTGYDEEMLALAIHRDFVECMFCVHERMAYWPQKWPFTKDGVVCANNCLLNAVNEGFPCPRKFTVKKADIFVMRTMLEWNSKFSSVNFAPTLESVVLLREFNQLPLSRSCADLSDSSLLRAIISAIAPEDDFVEHAACSYDITKFKVVVDYVNPTVINWDAVFLRETVPWFTGANFIYLHKLGHPINERCILFALTNSLHDYTDYIKSHVG